MTAPRGPSSILKGQFAWFRGKAGTLMNGRFRLPLRLLALLAMSVIALSPAISQAAGSAGKVDPRAGSLDMVLLLDKSLSMAPFFGDAKSYVAGQVLGPILIPGDRLVIELVYGKVERLWSGTIESEAEKAQAIRKIRTVVADGQFTDLGAALDAAKRDVDELGSPERPKYVLLVTDERQEAPPGSPYQARDFRLEHPFLDYVKKQDLGKFRAITVGIGVEAKVEAAATQVMKYLSEPPARGNFGTMAVESVQAATGEGSSTTAQAGAKAGKNATAAGATGLPGGSALPPWSLPAAGVLVALAIALFILIQSRKGKRSPEKEAHDA